LNIFGGNPIFAHPWLQSSLGRIWSITNSSRSCLPSSLFSLSIDANGNLPWSGLKNRVLLLEEDEVTDFLCLLPDHLATEVQRAYRWLKGSALETKFTIF